MAVKKGLREGGTWHAGQESRACIGSKRGEAPPSLETEQKRKSPTAGLSNNISDVGLHEKTENNQQLSEHFKSQFKGPQNFGRLEVSSWPS